MSAALPLIIALPFLAGAATLLVVRRRAIQRGVTLLTLLAVLVMAVATGVDVIGGGPLAVQVGGWPPGYAIPLVADALTTSLLVVMSLLAVACVAFAAASDEDRDGRYLPLVLIVVGGVSGVLLTGDLFNLFVFFEVMLAGSYVLLGIHRGSVRHSAVYIVTSLLASTLLLAGVALLYGTSGTLHLGRLSGAAVTDPSAALAGVVILTALAVKAAAVPVHGWLPRAYPAAPPAVTALFSGLLTKAGLYALLRVTSLLFDGQAPAAPVWAAIAVATMVVGVAGALGRGDIRGILSFHMISQIGYLLVIPPLLGTPAVVAAGVFFLLQYIVVKAGLFLVAGALVAGEGSDELGHLRHLARRRPVLAGVFMLLALSLAGLPPLSGFVAKYMLAVGAFGAGAYILGAAIVAVSLFTLLSMLKIWNGAFWSPHTAPARVRADDARLVAVPAGGAGEPPACAGVTGGRPAPGGRRRALLTLPALGMAVITVLAGIGAAPLVEVAEIGAHHLLDAAAYVRVTS